MAYNPYGVVQSRVNLAEQQQKAKQQGIETKEGVFKQKTKMKDEFMAELKEAEKQAQIALQQQMKKKKGGGFLKMLISAVNPFLGAVYSGVRGAREGQKAGEHAVDMATLAKQYATNLPSKSRWGKTFLRGAQDEYLTSAEKGYGDILTQAQDMSSKLSNPMEMFKTALGTGMSSFAMGKAMEAGGEKVGGLFKKGEGAVKGVSSEQAQVVKDVQPSFLDSLSMGGGVNRGEFINKLQEAYPELADLGKEDLLSMLQNPDYNPQDF